MWLGGSYTLGCSKSGKEYGKKKRELRRGWIEAEFWAGGINCSKTKSIKEK